MTDDFKREIERLLDEPGEGTAPPAPDRLRARLAATFSEALDETARAAAGDPANAATAAAYIDGQLTGASREKFAASLANEPALRADLEQAADLVYSTADKPVEVPKALMARASAAFAPAPPRPVATEEGWSLSAMLASLLPRQRLALAAIAAVALIVAVPAGLIVSGKFGGKGGEPELSGVEEKLDDATAKRVKECREKLAKEAKDGKSASMSKDAGKGSAMAPAKDAKDPCDPANLKDGAKK